MQFRTLGKTGVRVSAISLGGHEFFPNGAVKGFAQGGDATRRPDYIDPGFATPERRALVNKAIEVGINYFDATIDPEVAALNATLPPPQSSPTLMVQCRPQGMCYHYEKGNRGLTDLSRLRPEVERLIALSGRPKLDVLNFGIESPALEDDPKFLDHVARNIAALKSAGLIRFAACDTVNSGESYYTRMMRCGCFDVMWINFGPLWPFPAEKLFPLARELGVAIVTREAFVKGHLFRVAESAALAIDRPTLAGVAIRWILNHPEISTMVLGVRTAKEFESNLEASEAPLSATDTQILAQLRAHPAFAAAHAENERRFRK